MPSRSEHIRSLFAGSALEGHSTNQRKVKKAIDGERRVDHFQLGSKRQQNLARRHQEYLDNLSQAQFDRALGNLREGAGSNEDVIYVATRYASKGDLFAAQTIMRLLDLETLPVTRYPDPNNWNMDALDPVVELPSTTVIAEAQKGA